MGLEGPDSDDSGLIWAFRSAPRLSRGRSRSTFDKIPFFRRGARLRAQFSPSEAPLKGFLALSGRSLGDLGRSRSIPAGPQARPWWLLGASWDSLGEALWRSLATLGFKMAPRASQAPILA